MTRNYVISSPRFGQIVKRADSIAEARAFAQSLGDGATVSLPYRHCDRCDSAPCECPKRTLIVAVDGAGRVGSVPSGPRSAPPIGLYDRRHRDRLSLAARGRASFVARDRPRSVVTVTACAERTLGSNAGG
jgi:hypothetical protein